MTTANNKGRYGRYINTILILTDFILINLVFIATCFISPDIIKEHARVTMFLVNVSFIPIAIQSSSINTRRTLHMDQIVFRSLRIVGMHALFFLTLLFFLKIAHIPVKSFLILYGLMAISLPLWWIISRQILKSFRRKGRNYKKTIIIGSNITAQRLHKEMTSDAGYGYIFLGFFDDNPSEEIKKNYLGKIEDIDEYVKTHNVDEIYYTLSGENEKAIRTVTQVADNNVLQFYYVPQISKYISRRFEMYNMGQVPVLTLRHNPLTKHINRFTKRSFDIVFSSIVLLFSPIIFIPVAIAIKFSSPGPIFFKQLRTGYRGRNFYCWKFRTMRVNADSDKVQAQKHDPRKTKVGDFLRKTSIDELPQFINVFLGSMSVVGPRPHMLKHTQDYSQLINRYMVRHLIKPGITGWAQTNGYRGQTEELWQMEKRIEYDVWYIENWTFLLDLKIIVRTVLNAIQGEKNAF